MNFELTEETKYLLRYMKEFKINEMNKRFEFISSTFEEHNFLDEIDIIDETLNHILDDI